ncbi:unnamed protein product, partial [Anisakis simplex]|uniref:Uncharacterized protein n=1 Tax=Anisakis simplex TaxID=6269 RepID=A0A0M3KDA0_ANISI
METECGLSEGGSKWSFRSVESHLGAGSPSVRKKGTPVASDRESIDSTDSKGERSKLASILDRARLKGKKLVSSSRKRRSGEEVCQETILSSDEGSNKTLVVNTHTASETEKRAEKSAAAVGGTVPSSLQSCVNWHEASRQDLAGTPL